MTESEGEGAIVKRPIAAVILNWNRSDLTIACVEALLADSPSELGIFVVDNGSNSQDVRRLANLLPPGVKLMALDENTGYAGGNNRGVRAAIVAGAEFIMVMNNDVLMSGRDCVTCATVLARHPELGAIGPTVLSEPHAGEPSSIVEFGGGSIGLLGVGLHLYRGADLSLLQAGMPELYATEWLAGSAVMFRADAWQVVGGFDDTYFMYFEDVDISLRLLNSGWQIACLRDVVATHIAEASSTQLPLSGRKLRAYYATRNRLSMLRRHRPARYPLALLHLLLFLLPRTIIAGLIRGDLAVARAVGAGILDHGRRLGGRQRNLPP